MERVFLLLKRKYQLISLEELSDFYYKGVQLKNSCHITFDDGDVSFYETVLPILRKHNIPVSLYVSPYATKEQQNFWFQEIREYDKKLLSKFVAEYIQLNSIEEYPLSALLKTLPIDTLWKIIYEYREQTGTKPVSCMNMDVEQLKEVHSSGLVTIGAHTMRHPILKNESDESSYKEISDSVIQLSEILGEKIEYFAYPNGDPELDFSQREMNALKNLGIKLAFSTENRY